MLAGLRAACMVTMRGTQGFKGLTVPADPRPHPFLATPVGDARKTRRQRTSVE